MKISIITVCRNEKNRIERTLKSVFDQTFKGIEFIVIDGNSTDGTKNILSKYKGKIDILICEKDKGLYDAMNKGIKMATGDIIIFMNSGDCFYNKNVVERVVREWPDGAEIAYGDVYLNKERKIKDQSNTGKQFLMYDNICHQSMFIKRDCFKEVGLFDIKYKIAADFDWLLRAIYKSKLIIKHLNIVVANYEGGGKSSNKKVFDSEHGEILSKNFSSIDILLNRCIFKIADFVSKHI